MNRLSPILSLKQVSLQATIGSDFLLQDISFEITAGEIVGIVGASGAGKTSLLRLLNRLTTPNQGEIIVDEQLIERYEPVQLRRKVVLLLQESKLLGMKVIDALKYPLKLKQLPESEILARVDALSNLLRIPPEWFNKSELQLSVGQRQLVAIARALIMQPQIILLDEPTSSLDIGTATHVLTVLKQLNQSQNLTIIMVNHQLELLNGFCDRLLFIDQGILVEDVQTTEANWQKFHNRIVQLQQKQEQDWL
jgi:D-methionine transport system ATP-binding protein